MDFLGGLASLPPAAPRVRFPPLRPTVSDLRSLEMSARGRGGGWAQLGTGVWRLSSAVKGCPAPPPAPPLAVEERVDPSAWVLFRRF